ncbi:hypothetical protein NX059_009280 [Plenodomus lindquistii]|nr:hypothetical protein NX059_009280 [Plenodomus lindquistii]
MGKKKGISSLYVKSLVICRHTEQDSIRAIFSKARDMAPCLLIFEDLDSLVGDKVPSYFLNEVDGLEDNDGILMIGSTNHLDRLDPAISKRRSRFDRKYHFEMPGLRDRRAYAEYWGRKLEEGVVEWVGWATEGFSFACLKEVWVMALLSLMRGFEPSEDDGEEDEVNGKEGGGVNGGRKEQDKTEVCTCATTCATCHKLLPKPSLTIGTQTEEAVDIAAEARTKDCALADVPVPEHLVDNLLLKVIKHHIGVLRKEMDNTKDMKE